MTARFVVGDTRDVTASLPDGSVDLILTSPPFLALRSYLAADHEDKHLEIGSEANPAAFIDVLLSLTAEWRRVLAPHGSIVIELGDTYSGSGGAGGDYNDGGLRDGQERFDGSASRAYGTGRAPRPSRVGRESMKYERTGRPDMAHPISRVSGTAGGNGGSGWPLPKCLALVPELYRVALAYGINPLTGAPSPAGRWRVRNVVRWVRPNPPVGALGDKFRPATSDLVVACVAGDRWFDLDAVRTAPGDGQTGGLHDMGNAGKAVWGDRSNTRFRGHHDDEVTATRTLSHPAGAPPLDWWQIEAKRNAVRDLIVHIIKDANVVGSERTAEALLAHPDFTALLDFNAPLDWWQIVPGGYSGTTSTTRQVPCGPLDGGRRTTSPDCPIHADLPGQLPKAQRDARAETSATDTPRIGARHVQGQLGDSAPTDPHNEPGIAPESSGSTVLPCAPAANPRGKGSNRTALVPATSPVGTPSAETTDRTGHTPTSPESDGHRLDTPASSISGPVSSPDSGLETPSRIAGISSEDTPCTCSFTRSITKSTSHYAVFPAELCVRPIEAMCPRRVCKTCGKPSRRLTGDVTYEPSATYRGGSSFAASDRVAEGVNQWVGPDGAKASVVRQAPTVGWSSCGCPNTDGLTLDGYHTGQGWRAGLVFDPFAGSGTTLVVAHGHSRDSIGADLDPRNAELAAQRLGMFLEVETQERVA